MSTTASLADDFVTINAEDLIGRSVTITDTVGLTYCGAIETARATHDKITIHLDWCARNYSPFAEKPRWVELDPQKDKDSFDYDIPLSSVQVRDKGSFEFSVPRTYRGVVLPVNVRVEKPNS